MRSSYVLAGAIAIVVLIAGAAVLLYTQNNPVASVDGGQASGPASSADTGHGGNTNTNVNNDGHGTIKCYVTDSGSGDEKLTLWKYTFNEKTGSIENTQMVSDSPEKDPSSASVTGAHVYIFRNIPYGGYNITVEKGGSTLVDLNSPSVEVWAGRSKLQDSPIPPEARPSKGTIYGFVGGLGSSGIPDVEVTAWAACYDKSSGRMVNNGVARCTTGNPVVTLDGSYAGFYAFDGLEPGWYNIVAWKDDHTSSVIVYLSEDSNKGVRAIITMPGL